MIDTPEYLMFFSPWPRCDHSNLFHSPTQLLSGSLNLPSYFTALCFHSGDSFSFFPSNALTSNMVILPNTYTFFRNQLKIISSIKSFDSPISIVLPMEWSTSTVLYSLSLYHSEFLLGIEITEIALAKKN